MKCLVWNKTTGRHGQTPLHSRQALLHLILHRMKIELKVCMFLNQLKITAAPRSSDLIAQKKKMIWMHRLTATCLRGLWSFFYSFALQLFAVYVCKSSLFSHKFCCIFKISTIRFSKGPIHPNEIFLYWWSLVGWVNWWSLSKSPCHNSILCLCPPQIFGCPCLPLCGPKSQFLFQRVSNRIRSPQRGDAYLLPDIRRKNERFCVSPE